MVKFNQKIWVAVVMMGWGVVSAADTTFAECSDKNSVSMSCEDESSDASITSFSASISSGDFHHPELYNLIGDDETFFDYLSIPSPFGYLTGPFYMTNELFEGGLYLGGRIMNSGSNAAGYFLGILYNPLRINFDDIHGF